MPKTLAEFKSARGHFFITFKKQKSSFIILKYQEIITRTWRLFMKKLHAIVAAMPMVLTLGGCTSAQDFRNVYREFDDPQVVPRLLEIFQNKQDYHDNQPEEQSKIQGQEPIPEVMACFTLPPGYANVDKKDSLSPAHISARDQRKEDIIKKISQDNELKATQQWDNDQAKECTFRLLGNDIHESLGAMVGFAYDTRRELRKLGRFELG